MDCRKEEAKDETFVIYKNSSEEKVVSWRSRVVRLEEVTRRPFKGREHRVQSFSSVQSLSRVQLCNPMNRSTPGLPVHHQLPELGLQV